MPRKVKRRFRFYPDETQKIALAKVFGCSRFVYNAALEWRKSEYEAGGKPNYHGSSAWLTELKKEKEFLREVSCVPQQQALRHLQTAYGNFFRKRAKFPKFKRRDNRQSAEFTKSAFTFKNGSLCLAKIGKLNVAWSMDVPDPSSVTVVKEPSGKYFVTLTVEETVKQFPTVDASVGIDLGIETFATLSDGRKFKLPASIKKSRKRLAALQRQHSKKTKGSKRREKSRIKLARAHERVVNIRKDFLHKLSTSIVRENQAVAIEDLKVSAMMKNRRLARAIGEQGWREFRDMLAYKCEWHGRNLVVADRWLASSKTCSCCGEKTKLTLAQRSWVCPCGAENDRDVNAAKNILAAGHAASARGGSVRPARTYVLKARPSKREPLAA